MQRDELNNSIKSAAEARDLSQLSPEIRLQFEKKWLLLLLCTKTKITLQPALLLFLQQYLQHYLLFLSLRKKILLVGRRFQFRWTPCPFYRKSFWVIPNWQAFLRCLCCSNNLKRTALGSRYNTTLHISLIITVVPKIRKMERLYPADF